MTTTTFFFLFIPTLAVILLAVNIIFAPHNPYQEKDSVFECGFHSFLGQNRTQFSISFFIFALLFLLFDLEILLVYPYVVSAYINDVYGLIIMLIFFLALTLGFSFEIGKNALKIDSRQLLILIIKKIGFTTAMASLKNPFAKLTLAKFLTIIIIAVLGVSLRYGFNIESPNFFSNIGLLSFTGVIGFGIFEWLTEYLGIKGINLNFSELWHGPEKIKLGPKSNMADYKPMLHNAMESQGDSGSLPPLDKGKGKEVYRGSSPEPEDNSREKIRKTDSWKESTKLSNIDDLHFAAVVSMDKSIYKVEMTLIFQQNNVSPEVLHKLKVQYEDMKNARDRYVADMNKLNKIADDAWQSRQDVKSAVGRVDYTLFENFDPISSPVPDTTSYQNEAGPSRSQDLDRIPSRPASVSSDDSDIKKAKALSLGMGSNVGLSGSYDLDRIPSKSASVSSDDSDMKKAKALSLEMDSNVGPSRYHDLERTPSRPASVTSVDSDVKKATTFSFETKKKDGQDVQGSSENKGKDK